ncbi:MAG: TNT domain-containing protein [Lachnospiraceae bacterium]|nr:TNT domain-containing protein [Lachnospiraceae bacterium]
MPGTEKKIYLMAGDKIDRFGGKKGKFFSPTGTPMEMRALPYDADLSQYRQFEVVKPFEVEASTIAPAFGNIGLGTQYRSSVSVDVLLKKGIIKQVGGN